MDLLADAVKVNLGPRGRNVVIEKGPGAPRSTKDGVTVARETELEDHFANICAQMLRTVAARANDEAGDGTTSPVVLAQAILKEGAEAGHRGYESDGGQTRHRSRDRGRGPGARQPQPSRRDARGDRQVAEVASNGDRQVAELLAEATERVGREGAISVERAETLTPRSR